MLYTRKGDGGTTKLFGATMRCNKTDVVFEALGTIDELNSLIGICRAHARTCTLNTPSVSAVLESIQQQLFSIQAELAGADKRLGTHVIAETEELIHCIEERIPTPTGFTLPGTTILSGYCDYARSVSRRAERAVLRSTETRTVPEITRTYLNRLSSLLYALARYTATESGEKELMPTY